MFGNFVTAQQRSPIMHNEGSSRSLQHQAGMNKSKVVVAVNKDPDAPIFKETDYGVVGDVHQVLPAMIEEVKKLKGT